MNTRKKSTTRKSTPAGAKTPPKKKAARRPAARKKATKRPLKLVRHDGEVKPAQPDEARVQPQLGLVRGGKSTPSKREKRMQEALAEDLSQLPQAAVARVPKSRSFKQTDVATQKQMVLFRMARARTSVLAALQGLQPGSAEQLLAKKPWNARQMVLFLAAWDQEHALAIEPALAGVQPEWLTKARKHGEVIRVRAVERLDHLSWDDALRLLHHARQELLAALEDIPEEPAEIWAATHALGRLLHSVPTHDLEHADIVKRWRANEGK
jgi:hypothetical protein